MSKHNGKSFDKTSLGPPPRWLKCPRHGKPIDKKFIPFKTPLSNAYDDQVPEVYRFNVPMLFNLFKSMQAPIGLWIDLTNTDRFYNKEDVEKHGAKYYKLHCRGHGECPSEEQTNLFIHICKVFIKENPDSLIAVHCTHGFNRTGFLIASYMITEKMWSAEASVQSFADSRPPGIYKEDYLRALFERYDNVNDTPMAPALPDWCDESEPILNDQEADAGPSAGRTGARVAAQHVEGLPQVKLLRDAHKVRSLQKKCQQFSNWKKNGFPGSQPVSMAMENLHFLSEQHYQVTWKADGVRYMMLVVGKDEVYMFDRDHNVFQVPNLKFFYRKDLSIHLTETLMDGELIFDEFEGVKRGRFLIYDIIRFRGADVCNCDFERRKMCINLEIVQPRLQAMTQALIQKDEEPFSVRAKDFWDITQVENILSDKFQSKVTHEIDGLVFQPCADPYIPGRCMKILKWKPHHLNSIDFKLKIVKERKEGMLPEFVGYLFVMNLNEPFDRIKITKDLKQYDQKIIECSYENGLWKFMRERRDKSFPNAYETAMGVMRSIQNPITKELLLDFVRKRALKPKPVPQNSQKRPQENGHAKNDVMPPPNLMPPQCKKPKVEEQM